MLNDPWLIFMKVSVDLLPCAYLGLTDEPTAACYYFEIFLLVFLVKIYKLIFGQLLLVLSIVPSTCSFTLVILQLLLEHFQSL